MAKRRPAGDGLVRKRTDGRWEGRIVVGHREDGAPIFRSVFALTQKEVMRKLHSQIETYRDVELTEESNMTLGEILALQWTDLNFTTGELRITKSVTFSERELVLSEPKTKSSIRSIILPPSLLKVLGAYKKTVNSR